jgi:hypothetical protein
MSTQFPPAAMNDKPETLRRGCPSHASSATANNRPLFDH